MEALENVLHLLQTISPVTCYMTVLIHFAQDSMHIIANKQSKTVNSNRRMSCYILYIREEESTGMSKAL